MDPNYARPLNDEQVGYLYYYYTTELTPCLTDEGFDVSDPPSETTFVDQYSQAPWSPYDDVTTSSEDEWFALQEKCPQMPEALLAPSRNGGVRSGTPWSAKSRRRLDGATSLCPCPWSTPCPAQGRPDRALRGRTVPLRRRCGPAHFVSRQVEGITEAEILPILSVYIARKVYV